jgi:peptide/nickel transport system permease protein
MRFLAIRRARAILLLFAVSFFTSAFLVVSPGDFFQEIRLDLQISENTIFRFRTQYGMDQPFLIRYGRWLKSVGHGDLDIRLPMAVQWRLFFASERGTLRS